MTPDELPADMEGRLAEFADWMHKIRPEPFRYAASQITTDLRDLLKAYQEQRRALERIAHDAREAASEIYTSEASVAFSNIEDTAKAALNQKGDER
jgi:hypothetical protein